MCVEGKYPMCGSCGYPMWKEEMFMMSGKKKYTDYIGNCFFRAFWFVFILMVVYIQILISRYWHSVKCISFKHDLNLGLT